MILYNEIIGRLAYHELKKDGKIHLHVDYRVSGLGYAICGPDLKEENRIEEKHIEFSFKLLPM